MEFSKLVLENVRVTVSPGFGEKGYVRITKDKNEILFRQAVLNIKHILTSSELQSVSDLL